MEETAELVRAAAAGDQRAWNTLVDRFTGLLWAVARAHRLNTSDAADVVQTAWLRFVEHLATIREPERAGAWLATTARRESLRTLRRHGRAIPTDDETQLEPRGAPPPTPEERVVMSERDAQLWQAVDALPERCRRLLRVLMADPPPSYDDVSAALEMPVGSIGPTRARCLDRLRRQAGLSGITSDTGGSV